ncbi:uncharacterized protein LOC110038560, partial [Phalaenopsis equestris]
MFGSQTQSEISYRLPSLIYQWKNTMINAKSSTKTSHNSGSSWKAARVNVKFQDLYDFTVEGNIDDVNVLNEVRERVRQQAKVWWALEASKGANWYLQPQISSKGEGISVASLKLSVLTNTISLRKLIRKGIPPTLRPKVWLSVSGAAKKRSTVPESYYEDLILATHGKVTPSTRQIDH